MIEIEQLFWFTESNTLTAQAKENGQKRVNIGSKGAAAPLRISLSRAILRDKLNCFEIDKRRLQNSSESLLLPQHMIFYLLN